MNEAKYSLLIGTLNRPRVLSLCLEKLSKQSYKNFEVIIIDQSDDDESEKIVETFSDLMTIKYRHVKFKGLSRARNEAISLMSGDYFCLIDDDAEYPIDYLERANDYYSRTNEVVVLSAHIHDTISNSDLVNYKQIRNRNNLNLRNVIKHCPSAGLIFPQILIKQVGMFDEEFGVGAKYGACEETDYLLRCRCIGTKFAYDPKMCVFHPIIIEKTNHNQMISPEKHRAYSMGRGALFKKHMIYGKKCDLIPLFIENYSKKFVKAYVLKRNSASAKAQLSGFIDGFKSYKNKRK